MVDLIKIREYMHDHLKTDIKKRNVEVSGEDLEDALRQASIELALPIKKIDYEILNHGAHGIFGFRKKPWHILAYPSNVSGKSVNSEELQSDGKIRSSKKLIQDGRIYIKRDPNGILMKVRPPKNGGRRIIERDAVEALSEKQVLHADMTIVSRLVRRADDFFVKIANFEHNLSHDAVISLDIQDAELNAYISITPPGIRGADQSFDSIISFLRSKGIVFGYLNDTITDLADNPVYKQQIHVASGRKAVNGEDASIEFKFQVDTDNIRFKEIGGKVNYKDSNRVNNVVAGQVIATIIKSTPGIPGKTVTGKVLPVRDGHSVNFELGKNVSLSGDGLSAIADINGQALIINGKISVEQIFTVPQNVDLKTGNILFLGTVIIHGNVEDGFSVKASGNIEIAGSVGNCELDAEGDIIIRQGINGREQGTINVGGNIYARFIQNTSVIASGMVVVPNGIINSKIFSNKKILCKGKQASIVGGSLKATEEINAKTLGSTAHVETNLEVGFDPIKKEKLDNLHAEEHTISEQLAMLSKDIVAIERMVKTQRAFTVERKDKYLKLKRAQKKYNDRLTEIIEEQRVLSEHLSNLRTVGKISASATVFPGVRISIRNAFLEVRNEFRRTTFVNDDNIVKLTKYEEIAEDVGVFNTLRNNPMHSGRWR